MYQNVVQCKMSMAPHKSTFVYTMNGDPLSVVTEHKYLGILSNDKLS